MVKPPTTYKEQIELLKTHGCIILNDVACEKTLSNINYYRLSAYFIPFKETADSYKPNTIFENIVKTYNFDRKIRIILFGAIETLEIFLRARFAYFHAHKYGALGYLDSSNYISRHNHRKLKDNINKELNHNCKLLFVKHHNEKYKGEFPVWVIIELFSFGMLSYFYKDLNSPDQKELSHFLWDSIPTKVSSWLQCCTNLRNICAHSGRLYNQVFTATPAGMSESIPDKNKRKLWGAIFALKSSYPNEKQWNEEVATPIINLINEYHDVINLSYIGFPKDTWKTELLCLGLTT